MSVAEDTLSMTVNVQDCEGEQMFAMEANAGTENIGDRDQLTLSVTGDMGEETIGTLSSTMAMEEDALSMTANVQDGDGEKMFSMEGNVGRKTTGTATRSPSP